mgnify:CR=1 FL=1
METSFKSRAFPFVFWIMIIVLLLDTYDTFSREVIGYFKGSIPLGDIPNTKANSLISLDTE